MKSPYRLVIISLLLWGCRAHLAYVNDYPMSNVAFSTRDQNLKGLVPQGWFSSRDDSLTPTLAAWLIKDDYSASISIRELFLDPITTRQVQNEGLEFLARISMGFHSERLTEKSPAWQPTTFEMKGRKFCHYEILTKQSQSRVVVFSAGGRYYECEAQPAQPGLDEKQIKELFRIQQSVLASLAE